MDAFRSKPVNLAVILWCLLLDACTVNPASHTTARKRESGLERLHYVGRVERDRDSVRYAWSGAGFVARFEGTGALVALKDQDNEHQIILDGQPQSKIVTRTGVSRYLLARGLRRGEHQVEVYRRTEALFGVTQVEGFDVIEGSVLPPAPPPVRRIELIGDSISCGYGNEGASPDCKFSPHTENHYLSYGAILARTFQAELSTVAWSGRGVVKNYAAEPGEKMGTLYRRVLPESSTQSNVVNGDHDLVVVNLGTNDFSTEPDPEEEFFAAEYLRLLVAIRELNPAALILCTVGPMLEGEDLTKARRAIALAVERMESSGDARVLSHELTIENEQPGCDWHPGLSTHQQMADELAQAIRLRLDWRTSAEE